MNVFILGTGRCGSLTFINACKYISNYTAGHETRAGTIGKQHFMYPNNHIEADNRLSWFLGRLDDSFGDSAIYIHLKRDELATAKSFLKRYNYKKGILWAYRMNMFIDLPIDEAPEHVAIDYVNTVNSNIQMFMRKKSKKMTFNLENAKQDFKKFWELIEAEGNFENALKEWDKSYNTSIDNKDGLKRKIKDKIIQYLMNHNY